jgi:NADH pyrophosphatase NudC (nudix superfamily)
METIKKLYNAGYRKQSEGEWVLTGTFKSTFPLPAADLHTACSVCGWKPPKYSADYKEYNFCPNCGAKMRKEDEGK